MMRCIPEVNLKALTSFPHQSDCCGAGSVKRPSTWTTDYPAEVRPNSSPSLYCPPVVVVGPELAAAAAVAGVEFPSVATPACLVQCWGSGSL